ncbi:MAG: polysaccharide deacetylase family protein [Bacteroidota bacterium]
MLIYTPTITSRIKYIFQYIGEITGLSVELTDSISRYKNAPTTKLNYSSEKIEENEYQIIPCGLLQEKGIRIVEIKMNNSGPIPFFFETPGTFPFDLPAAIFYLISRYEEYLSFIPDLYERYPHENSLATKENFLHRPLVDEWMNEWMKQLQVFFPSLPIRVPMFRFIPTYDIDIAWSYLHKSVIRNMGGAIKNLNTISERIRVLAGKEKDPYDCYDTLRQLHQEYEQRPIYFFLVANKKSSLDKNINPHNKAFKQLIEKTSTHAIVGLHPSGYSHTDPSIVNTEKKFLEKIIERSVIHSRQHYLKFSLPKTYHTLVKAGITHDYSMGYGSVNGFRASTSRSFLWYDLKMEEVTSLRIHPMAWMDANSYYENKFTPAEALDELEKTYKRVNDLGGDFIMISHNHLLGDRSEWVGWPDLYFNWCNKIYQEL